MATAGLFDVGGNALYVYDRGEQLLCWFLLDGAVVHSAQFGGAEDDALSNRDIGSAVMQVAARLPGDCRQTSGTDGDGDEGSRRHRQHVPAVRPAIDFVDHGLLVLPGEPGPILTQPELRIGNEIGHPQ